MIINKNPEKIPAYSFQGSQYQNDNISVVELVYVFIGNFQVVVYVLNVVIFLKCINGFQNFLGFFQSTDLINCRAFSATTPSSSSFFCILPKSSMAVVTVI